MLAWTQRLAPKVWHWVSTNSTGNVLLAGEAGGSLYASTDGGASWTSGNSPSGIWISSDMSASGDRMVALQYGGGMYMSTDFGTTWQRVAPALVNDPNGLSFESVTISQDGQHIAANIQPNTTNTPEGRVVLSDDAGATWRVAALPAGTFWWRGIDSSANGQVIVSVAHTSEIFLSTDGGTNWSPLQVSLGGVAVTENWYRVKMSADGNTIAVAANSFGGAPGSGIFVSHDRGATWTRGFTQVADYTAIAMSSDGSTIAASMSNTNGTPGRVVFSSDGGASFAALDMPGTDTDWRALAMSLDASRFAAATGLFTTATPGQLYTAVRSQ